MRRVVVVGGGITGLAAAYEAVRHPDVHVTVLEGSGRLGGNIATSTFAGLAIDEAADGFLVRVPWATQLAREVGLGERLTHPATSHARLAVRGTLRPLPPGLLMGVPTDVLAVARARVLSVGGLARAAIEPLLPRTRPTDSVGELVGRRFGRQVVERLVDPLLGGVYAGDADRMSVAAAVPQLAALAGGRSLLLSARAQRATTSMGAPDTAAGGPVFAAPIGGMGELVEAVAAAASATGRVEVHTDRAVSAVEPGPGGGVLVDGALEADAVVLATPAAVAAALVRPVAPGAADLLAAIAATSVAMVTLAVPAATVGPDEGSGLLVPKPEQRTITACSFGSNKWAHWRPMDGSVVVRASVGHAGEGRSNRALGLDDAALVAAVVDDLARLLRRDVVPSAARVIRWPAALPQYLPGHLDRLAEIEAEVRAALPGVHLAGASYRGIGIPACIRQGREAAAAALAATEVRA